MLSTCLSHNMQCIMASTYFCYLVLTLTLFPLFTLGNLPSCPIDYIYQLGDSIEDTGNIFRVLPVDPFLAAASSPPYGETFPGTPTGRWSDGRLIIDYIATALGLPLLNPYRDKTASFDNGVNFAEAGATGLDKPYLATQGIIIPPTVTTISGQLQELRDYLASICGSIPGECARKRLNSSLVNLGDIGGSDLVFGLLQGKSPAQLRLLVPSIIDVIINATREVIQLGAVQVVIPGVYPFGCLPNFLNMFKTSDPTSYDIQGCLRNLNELSIFQNNNLQRALLSLRLEFPNIKIIYFDSFNALRTVLLAAPTFGFDRTTLLKACCGNGTFGTCGIAGTGLCSDPSRYISWDGLHFTQETYRRISDLLILHLRLKIPCIFQ